MDMLKLIIIIIVGRMPISTILINKITTGVHTKIFIAACMTANLISHI